MRGKISSVTRRPVRWVRYARSRRDRRWPPSASITSFFFARLAEKELSSHRTQYGDEPAKALASNNLHDFEQPLPFLLAKSLTGGAVTGDIMDGVGSRPIPFAPVRGYRPPENPAGLSIELG